MMNTCKIDLRPITLADTDNIVKWRNASFVKCNLYTQNDISSTTHIKYYHEYVEKKKVFQFVISILSSNSVTDIGTVFLKKLDNENRKAEFGIFIGEKKYLGKGYGQAATKQILEYAFVHLKLNRVYLTVFSDNISAIKAYEKSGFQYEGCLKQDFLRYDGFADVTVMGITKDVYEYSKKED